MSTQCPLNRDNQNDCCVKPDLTTQRLSTSTLAIEEGHILSSQAVIPVVTHANATGAGLTAAVAVTTSTDVVGAISITGTAAANATVTLTYHNPYPVNASVSPIVSLTPLNAPATVALTGANNVIVGCSRTGFVLTFVAVSGVNPVFGYSVVAPVAA